MPDEPVGFSEADAKRIAQTVRAYEGGISGAKNHPLTNLPDRNYTRIAFRNESGEEVPGYAVMRITGIVTLGEQPVLRIAKPNTTLQRIYLVNGPTPIAVNSGGVPGRGIGSFLWHADYVLYDTANTPAYGETWGPQDATWTIKKGLPGFRIMGGNTGSGSTARTIAVQAVDELYRGVANFDAAQGETKTVSRYLAGTITDSTIDDSVIFELGSVSVGDKVYYLPDGENLYAIAAECDAADPGVTDHGALTGLTDDDHNTLYPNMAGRSGGQTLTGDTATSGNLTLASTAHATKGKLLIGTSAYDEANNRFGVGTASPSVPLDVVGAGKLTGTLTLGSGPTTVSDSAGKILSAALNTVAIANGGTASTTASDARTALGLAIGTNVQAFDADLSALAANSTDGLWAHTGAGTGSARAITGTAQKIIITNGDGVAGNPTITIASDYVGQASLTTLGTITTGAWNGSIIGGAYGGTNNGFFEVSGPATTLKTFTFPNATCTVLTTNAAVTVAQGGTGAADASGARTNLGVVIGTQVQAWDTQLDSLAALSYTGNAAKFIAVNGAENAFELVPGVITGTPGGTDNRLTRADGTGTAIQGSAIVCDDSGNLSSVGTISSGAITAPSLTGGTGSGADLVISSTSHATKGDITIGNLLTVYETLSRVVASTIFRVENGSGTSCFQVSDGANTVTLRSGMNIVFDDASSGSKIGTANGQKIGFWGATPVVQQVLATGASATVDNVISLLQLIGLCRQL